MTDKQSSDFDVAMNPPEGYESWLVYAVNQFDARPALAHTIFDDTSSTLREQVESRVWAELNELRARAGLQPIAKGRTARNLTCEANTTGQASPARPSAD